MPQEYIEIRDARDRQGEAGFLESNPANPRITGLTGKPEVID